VSTLLHALRIVGNKTGDFKETLTSCAKYCWNATAVSTLPSWFRQSCRGRSGHFASLQDRRRFDKKRRMVLFVVVLVVRGGGAVLPVFSGGPVYLQFSSSRKHLFVYLMVQFDWALVRNYMRSVICCHRFRLILWHEHGLLNTSISKIILRDWLFAVTGKSIQIAQLMCKLLPFPSVTPFWMSCTL
jgi:hypothetical protein